MSQIEIENIIALAPFKRYKYFVKKVAGFDHLWTIVNTDGEVAISEIEGT